jgi:hypothetical protein
MSDLSYTIEAEADGIYLFRRTEASAEASLNVEKKLGGVVSLSQVEVAAANEEGMFGRAAVEPIAVVPGQQMRVSLYWAALDDLDANWTVSVRVVDSSGALAAQHDGWPGQGKKPTSWWEKGWQIRDVHYMTISPHAPSGPAQLVVTVYDSQSMETIPFEGFDMLPVCDLWIESL